MCLQGFSKPVGGNTSKQIMFEFYRKNKETEEEQLVRGTRSNTLKTTNVLKITNLPVVDSFIHSFFIRISISWWLLLLSSLCRKKWL